MHTGFFLADPLPLRLGLHEELNASPSEGLRQHLRVRHHDLEIRPAAQRALKRPRDPVTTNTCLFEHQVRGTERDVREALLRARVEDVEAAQVAPELDALIQVDHERGFEGSNHRIIVAVLGLRSSPGSGSAIETPLLGRQ